MNTRDALQHIRSLANGVHPLTQEQLAPDDPCQHSEVVRALFAAVDALEQVEAAERRKRALPANTGKPWSEAEEDTLCRYFDHGRPIALIARDLGRTRGAILARLERTGRGTTEPDAQAQQKSESGLAVLHAIGERVREQRAQAVSVSSR